MSSALNLTNWKSIKIFFLLLYIFYTFCSSIQMSLQRHVLGRSSSNRVGGVTESGDLECTGWWDVCFSKILRLNRQRSDDGERAQGTSNALLCTSPCPSLPRRVHGVRFSEPRDVSMQHSNSLCVWNPSCCQTFLQIKMNYIQSKTQFSNFLLINK